MFFYVEQENASSTRLPTRVNWLYRDFIRRLTTMLIERIQDEETQKILKTHLG